MELWVLSMRDADGYTMFTEAFDSKWHAKRWLHDWVNKDESHPFYKMFGDAQKYIKKIGYSYEISKREE